MPSFSALQTGWWCFALPGYRDHPQYTTYSLFAYDELPRLDVPLDSTFHWLLTAQPHAKWSLASNGYVDGTKPDLRILPHLAEQAEVDLPLAFTTFLQSPELHQRIRSCTACYLDLGNYALRTTNPTEGALIHFLSDQQWCLHWYLAVNRIGEHCVMVSHEGYGFDFGLTEPHLDAIDLVRDDLWLCAPSFTEFIYRFWLENEIWFALTNAAPLTVQQRAYLEQYR